MKKYIEYHNSTTPLTEAEVNSSTVLFKKVFPYPFNTSSKDIEKIQLRVYSFGGKFNSRVVENNRFVFDILIPKEKNAWLLTNGIRPYLMMQEIIKVLNEVDIGIGGTLQFIDFKPIIFNDEYQGLRLMSELINFSTGRK